MNLDNAKSTIRQEIWAGTMIKAGESGRFGNTAAKFVIVP